MIGAYRQPTGNPNLGMQSPVTFKVSSIKTPFQLSQDIYQIPGGNVDLNVSRAGPTAAAGGDDLLQQILKANPGADPAKIKEALKGAGTKATGF